jgi:hypothetical protein
MSFHAPEPEQREADRCAQSRDGAARLLASGDPEPGAGDRVGPLILSSICAQRRSALCDNQLVMHAIFELRERLGEAAPAGRLIPTEKAASSCLWCASVKVLRRTRAERGGTLQHQRTASAADVSPLACGPRRGEGPAGPGREQATVWRRARAPGEGRSRSSSRRLPG